MTTSTIAAELKRNLNKWPLRAGFALVDQGLISGSNFIVAILLGRWLAPGQYGVYALAFEVFLFLSVVYGALILEPMSVFGPSIYRNEFHSYLGILLRIHCAVSIAIVAAGFAAARIVSALRPGSSLPSALVGIAIASPCLLLFWLARRGFYVHLLPQKAALGACVYSAVLLAGVAVVSRLHLLSSFSAFLMMAAAAVVTGPLMLTRFKASVPALRGRQLHSKEVLVQHWKYGRWALASSVVIWFSAALYYPLLGSYFTLADTGEFKALMNLASPIGQVFVALTLLSLPYVSKANHEDGSAAGRLARKLTFVYIGGTSIYWVFVLFARGPLVHHLYAGKYTQIASLLPWLALGSILRIAATAQAIVLRAMRSPSKVFVAYFSACVVALVVGIPSTRHFGLRGALLTWVLSSGTALAGAALMVHLQSRKISAPDSIAARAFELRQAASLSTR